MASDKKLASDDSDISFRFWLIRFIHDESYHLFTVELTKKEQQWIHQQLKKNGMI